VILEKNPDVIQHPPNQNSHAMFSQTTTATVLKRNAASISGLKMLDTVDTKKAKFFEHDDEFVLESLWNEGDEELLKMYEPGDDYSMEELVTDFNEYMGDAEVREEEVVCEKFSEDIIATVEGFFAIDV